MMRKIYRVIMSYLLLTFLLYGCGKSSNQQEIASGSTQPEIQMQSGEQTETKIQDTEENEIQVIVNGTTYTTVLEDNVTTEEFISMLPLTLEMEELNGNEKFNYMDTSLTTNASTPSGIHSGDLMLYGSECLVLFYEDFSTSYSYTPIGHLENAEDLVSIVGDGSVTVIFRAGEFKKESENEEQ